MKRETMQGEFERMIARSPRPKVTKSFLSLEGAAQGYGRPRFWQEHEQSKAIYKPGGGAPIALSWHDLGLKLLRQRKIKHTANGYTITLNAERRIVGNKAFDLI